MNAQVPKTRGGDFPVICAGDCCEQAVKRAYREMKEQGRPDQFALDAARTVFHWHHPEISFQQADNIITLWVHDGVMH